MSSTLTIIIPTIGRDSIEGVLKALQPENRLKIIILAHGRNAYAKVVKYALCDRVRIIECSETLALSDVCNIGLDLVDSDFFGFFSDDDIWLFEKTNKLLDFLEKNPDIDIAVGSTLEQHPKMSRIRPHDILTNNQPLLSYLFEKAIVFTNPRYVGLQDAIMRNTVYPMFRPKLSVYEDLIWLSDAQKLGRKIAYIGEVVSIKRPSLSRSSSRQSKKNTQHMYEIIKEMDANLAANYLRYHALRSAIGSGNVQHFAVILNLRIKLVGLGRIDSFLIPLQIFQLVFFWVRRLLKINPL